MPRTGSNKKRRAALSGEIRPVVKPDCSNVLKGIEDAMNGVVWVDDRQAVDVRVSKSYAEIPEAIVTVREICV
ncbi:MAG: RusA family crossover junction endodeoxyribonuclease [Azoarcus sp.]|nr:RusA family crossover junction endodeoxyribonuclease [Azoarcus sp.]